MVFPRVSVCMPVFNGCAFIREALESVLRQTFSEFEVVIVDDGSTDKTMEYIYSFNDPRIRVFRNANRLGSVLNHNRCVTYAQSAYIKLFHQDDTLAMSCLEEQVRVLDEDPAVGFVFSCSYAIDERGSLLYKRTPPFSQGRIGKQQILRKYFFQLDYNFIGEPPVGMLRKSMLDNKPLFTSEWRSSDIELWTRINLSHPCFFIDKPLAYIRKHDGQSYARTRDSIVSALDDNRRLCLTVLRYDIPFLIRFSLAVEFMLRIPILLIGRSIKKVSGLSSKVLLVYCLRNKIDSFFRRNT
ncbi:MAG: glycosyltransferase family 2 protein [Candidatus Omnitrophica bacterium]|nr:glycosyltransferase family 2 protein [Candidatus Omnitrophota bacterium]